MHLKSKSLSRFSTYLLLIGAALGATACAETPQDSNAEQALENAATPNAAPALTFKKLSVARYSQQPYGNLCWATCTAMVASYFGSDSIDRTVDIAQQHFATTDELKFNQRLPSQNSEVVGQMVQRYVDNVSYLAAEPLSWGHGASLNVVYAELSYDLAKLYVDNSFPIVAMLSGAVSLPGGAHAVVVVGYDERDGQKQIIYNDPWDGNEHSMDADSFRTTGYVQFYQGALAPVLPEPPAPLNDSFATAKLIRPPSSPDTLEHIDAGQERYYSFTAPAEATYVIKTFGDADTIGTLFAEDKTTVLAFNDDGQGTDDYQFGGNFTINAKLSGMKTYYVKVRLLRRSIAGDYRISVTMKTP